MNSFADKKQLVLLFMKEYGEHIAAPHIHSDRKKVVCLLQV